MPPEIYWRRVTAYTRSAKCRRDPARSLAHLLVNGDVPSLILFGGIGLWALLAMRLINAAEPAPEPFEGGTLAGDIRLVVITSVVFGVIALVHSYVGPSPFGAG